jgi:hypothetical protein
MARVLRVLGTLTVLLIVLVFRGTRLAAVATGVGGAYLRRVWVTGPSRSGTLGRKSGAPRWVRAATGRVAGSSLTPVGEERTGSLFDPPSSKPLPGISRWW